MITLSQVRGVEWGRTYLWELKFSSINSPPAPFSEWFPAIDVEDDEAVLESFVISDAYMGEIKIPLNTTSKNIKITFIDDVDRTLSKWLKEWINVTILNNNQYVSTVTESVKLVTVSALNTDKTPIEGGTNNYWIYPEDTLMFVGNSSSDLPIYSINFVKVGRGK